MTVLIFEDNLIWSERLRKSVAALGHVPVVLGRIPDELPKAEAAILNLTHPKLWSPELAARLKQSGIFLIAHAGHKEKVSLQSGRAAGVDRIVSNGELTFKLEKILSEASSP